MNKLISFLLLSLSAFSIVSAHAAIESTTATEKAPSVTIKVDQHHPIVRQKVSINYLLAVPGYFNGSTRFELPSLSKGRLSQASEFAVNGSTFIEGEKYATQLWQIDLYPEQKGTIELPALSFTVQYIDAQQNQKTTRLDSDSVVVFSYLPEALTEVDHYMVSSDVELSETWSMEKEKYEVGDIIQRDITITAEDLTSIQIPAIKFNKVEGVQITAKEAQLEDESNRGEQTATLKQTITYVIKQPGSYSLGGEKVDWWHLQKQLQQANFEAKVITVSGISAIQIKIAAVLVVVILLFIYFYLKIKKRPPSLLSQLKRALKNQQWALFITLLYQKADTNAMLGLLKHNQDSDTSEKLLTAYYQAQQKTPKEANISQAKLKELIK